MIYTSSRVYFYIKNLISNSFNHFKTALDWGSFKQEHRGLGVRIQRPSAQRRGTAGSNSHKQRDSFVICASRRGTFRPEPHDPTSTARIRSSLL